MGEMTVKHGTNAGFGRLGVPLRLLFDNRSLRLLVIAFAAMTLAEWGYVTALAIDAFGPTARWLSAWWGSGSSSRRSAASSTSPFSSGTPRVELLTAIAGARFAIVATSAALAATGGASAPRC